ncbi:hypothetical protein H4R19_000140 [Coemansia spiralis]|nr:hypothetical protein H4R19_000140 [Coemansia spiralis]
MLPAPGLASVASIASCFDTFRQKLYLQGVLGKKNDRDADGRPYGMRKWTRWYVELRGPVLIFWNLLDPQLSAYLEDVTAIVDGRVQNGSPEFERTVAHIKNIVLKPNFINITDAACSIVGKLKKRDSVWTLHSSGANRFYMQAVDDRAMNEWVRALRLACFEAAKLYEYYSAALVNERHPAALAAPRPAAYQAQVRFSGTNDWIPCEMAVSAGPARLTFVAQSTRAQLAVLSSPRHSYAIYPDSLDSVDAAVIAKLEGDCDIDASLHPKIDNANDELPVATSRTHGSYALVIFQSPAEMAAALAEIASCARLYRMPAGFAPDVVPDREKLYLLPSDVADKSIEIMEPVTARRMLDNVAAERCARLDLPDHGGGYSTSGSTAHTETPAAAAVAHAAAATTKMPWDSEGSADEADAVPVASNGKHRPPPAAASQPRPAKGDEADTETEAQPQKRHFRFLHKSGRSKGDSARNSAASLRDSIASNGSGSKGAKLLTKALSPTTTSSANTSTASRDGMRNSTSEKSLSHSSTAPSLPTPALGATSHGTFADEASEAIVNLKIAESPRPANNGLARTDGQGSQPARQLAVSDTESDSDEPLGDIVSRNSQAVGMAPRQQQLMPPQPAPMHRASTATAMLGGAQQAFAMQQQQQQPGMMMSMVQQTQSMYGAVPNVQHQMYPQLQPQAYGQDPALAMGGQMMGPSGMAMPLQGPGSARGRPTTYMDAAGGVWSMPQPQHAMMGMGMDSVGGPLLTMDRKVDPIERPTGLVGAIATREQMKSEQKYRDSSSLMKERQMRRNQAMGMANPAFPQPAGPRFGGGGAVNSMYGAPQGWADDTMSLASGVSGRAPYAQLAPSLSAEQLSGVPMRGTIYGGVPLNGMGAGMVAPAGPYGAEHDDDVALSVYAGARMSMAAPDVHPLRAAMQSGMSVSSPHLSGLVNPYQLQQMQMLQQQQQMQQQQQLQQQMQMQQQQQLQLQQQQQQQWQLQLQQASMGMPMGQPVGGAFAMDQQRRMSAMGANGTQRASVMHPISPGNGAANAMLSRHSVTSSNSGSGGSSGDSSPLAMQQRAPANRWAKEASSLRVQSNVRGGGDRSSTVPRRHDGSSDKPKARANIASVYELPGRASANRAVDPGHMATGYTSQSDDNDDGDSDSDASGRGKPAGKMSKELRQYFDLFGDKCLDVKPYAWLDFDVAYSAYTNFCNRNGMRGKSVAASDQFKELMDEAEWQLKTKRNGARAYYNAYLLQ